MRSRALLCTTVSVIGLLGLSTVNAAPASAATCDVTYLRGSVFTNGYVDGVYLFGPQGVAYSTGCVAVEMNVIVQPLTGRVVSPGTCNSTTPQDPVVNPSYAHCEARFGSGGAAADALSYPYATMTVNAFGIGTGGAVLASASRSCTIPIPSATDYGGVSCNWSV
jgi:hypothetical protein